MKPMQPILFQIIWLGLLFGNVTIILVEKKIGSYVRKDLICINQEEKWKRLFISFKWSKFGFILLCIYSLVIYD